MLAPRQTGGFTVRVSPDFADIPEARGCKFTERRPLWGVPVLCFLLKSQPRVLADPGGFSRTWTFRHRVTSLN